MTRLLIQPPLTIEYSVSKDDKSFKTAYTLTGLVNKCSDKVELQMVKNYINSERAGRYVCATIMGGFYGGLAISQMESPPVIRLLFSAVAGYSLLYIGLDVIIAERRLKKRLRLEDCIT